MKTMTLKFKHHVDIRESCREEIPVITPQVSEIQRPQRSLSDRRFFACVMTVSMAAASWFKSLLLSKIFLECGQRVQQHRVASVSKTKWLLFHSKPPQGHFGALHQLSREKRNR